MMIVNIQEVIQHAVCPSICGVLSAGRTESGFTGVRNNSEVTTARTNIKMEAESRSPAGDDPFDRLEYDRSDPSFVLLGKSPPMEAEYL